jgi:adenylylsulfate kinase-like enzyme
MADAGLIVITAFISPYQAGRAKAAQAAGERFYKIYLDADLKVCEARDPKGLYKKARAGKISDFTGIDSPYETPERPDLVIDTVNNSVEDCVRRFMNFIMEKSALGSGKEKTFAVQ